MANIYISAGHGGRFPGCAHHGMVEKDINLDMALAIVKHLSKYECNIKLARTTDVTKRITERTTEANAWPADLVVDLHYNGSNDPRARGFETYVHPSIPLGNRTEEIRATIHNEIFGELLGKTPDRGTKTANFQVLRDTDMAAVLIEYLFLSNKDDAALVEPTREALAEATARGIAIAFDLKKKPKPKPTKGQKFHRVVAGSFRSRERAEARMKDLKKKGFDSFMDIFIRE